MAGGRNTIPSHASGADSSKKKQITLAGFRAPFRGLLRNAPYPLCRRPRFQRTRCPSLSSSRHRERDTCKRDSPLRAAFGPYDQPRRRFVSNYRNRERCTVSQRPPRSGACGLCRLLQNENEVDARMCIRVAGDLAAALPAIRKTVARIDPDVPITETLPLIDQVRGT